MCRSPGLTSGAPLSDDERAGVWAALADPTRRRLLDQLSETGPQTATELAREFPVSRQAVSKHLTALSAAGLVSTQRQGRDIRYRVEPDRLTETAAWLAEVGRQWDVRLDALRRRFEEG